MQSPQILFDMIQGCRAGIEQILKFLSPFGSCPASMRCTANCWRVLSPFDTFRMSKACTDLILQCPNLSDRYQNHRVYTVGMPRFQIQFDRLPRHRECRAETK